MTTNRPMHSDESSHRMTAAVDAFIECWAPEDRPQVLKSIRRLIAEAVSAEREACAKLAETLSITEWEEGGRSASVYPPTPNQIAAEIRARGGG